MQFTMPTASAAAEEDLDSEFDQLRKVSPGKRRSAMRMHANGVGGKSSAAQLWQKEASDIQSKSELLMFLYFTQCALLPGQILCLNTHPLERYVRKTS